MGLRPGAAPTRRAEAPNATVRWAPGCDAAVEPLLAVLAAAAFAAPPLLAWRCDRQARAFQREAFGRLARAARNVRLMVWCILAYYAGVVAGSVAVGDVGAMVQWPMPARGAVVYLRLGAAVLGYVLMLGITRELYLVVRPPRAPGTSAGPPHA